MAHVTLKLSLVMAMLALLVGCTKISSSTNSVTPSEPRISESEIRAYCPRVSLTEGDAFTTLYERGGEDDPARIIYRVAFDKVTRACRYGDGQITMEVAAAGRVVPGPKFNQTSLTLPIYVRARRGEEVLYEKNHPFKLDSLTSNEATQFLFKDDRVIFAQPEARNVFVFVGFSNARP